MYHGGAKEEGPTTVNRLHSWEPPRNQGSGGCAYVSCEKGLPWAWTPSLLLAGPAANQSPSLSLSAAPRFHL